jgi:UDP-N-acetylglucosamine 4-epimerase
LPKVEEKIGNPLSPYAVTKAAIEQFADVFGKTYGLKWIGLRYFNVFGPKQNPNNLYAAVIPIFTTSIINDKQIYINGDGESSRDFTHISNVLSANELSLFVENTNAINQTFNIACGSSTSLNNMVSEIQMLLDKKANVEYREFRKGDVKHSLADISKARRLLNYSPKVGFNEGLKLYINYLRRH